MVGYALLGAVVFRAVESPHETYIQSEVTSARTEAVRVAWNATFRVNKLNRDRWKEIVYAQVKSFQRRTMWAIKKGYDGKELGISAQWTVRLFPLPPYSLSQHVSCLLARLTC